MLLTPTRAEADRVRDADAVGELIHTTRLLTLCTRTSQLQPQRAWK
jgi:hypothetical protein